MRLRVGVVGCGKIAEAHIEEIRHIPDVSVVAVCDLEPIMAEQVAVRFGIPKHYDDFDRMLGQESLDVVHITTPPQSHVVLAQKAASAGAHVFIEKPLAMTYADAQRIIEVIERSQRKLSINYWYNFENIGARLRELYESGTLGSIVHVESFMGYSLAGPFGQALLADEKHWVHGLPGKLFHNNIDHVINKITPFLPEGCPVNVQASAFRRRTDLKNNATDLMFDELRASLRCGDMTAQAVFTSHVRPLGHFVRVYGEKNTVEVDYNTRTVTFSLEQKYPSALGRLLPPFQHSWWSLKEGWRNVREFRRYEFGFFVGMRRLIEMFYKSVRTGAPLPIPYSEMLRTTEIIQTINSQVYGAGCASEIGA